MVALVFKIIRNLVWDTLLFMSLKLSNYKHEIQMQKVQACGAITP